MLALLVGLDVELEMNPRIERAVSLLRLVLEIDLGKRHTHGLRSRHTAAVGDRDAGDDDVVHLDDEVLLLAFARFALRDGGFFQVCARRARLQQIWRRLVDVVEEGKVGERRLAGAGAGATATAGLKVRGICDAPGERQHLDFILVFGIVGFPFDVSDLCKDV